MGTSIVPIPGWFNLVVEPTSNHNSIFGVHYSIFFNYEYRTLNYEFRISKNILLSKERPAT
jgi:hypothetical protein